jgi:hypothetical protein
MRLTLPLWRLPWYTDFAFIFRNSTFTGLSIRPIGSGNKDKDDPMTPLGISPKRTPVPNPFVHTAYDTTTPLPGFADISLTPKTNSHNRRQPHLSMAGLTTSSAGDPASFPAQMLISADT